jgi:hypothetical protein
MQSQTLFDILSNNERIIVWSAEGQLYTWNQSKTLQCWDPIVDQDTPEGALFQEVDCKSLDEDPPHTFEQAKQRAINWHLNLLNERLDTHGQG